MNKIITILIILILLVAVIFFGFKYFSTQSQLQKISSISKINTNVLAFDKLFVEKVLKTQGEVSYQDRLNLENTVINTKDNTIIDGWHNFLASTTEADAQSRVLVLLSMFTDKIIY
jgi:hypothetical protein